LVIILLDHFYSFYLQQHFFCSHGESKFSALGEISRSLTNEMANLNYAGTI